MEINVEHILDCLDRYGKGRINQRTSQRGFDDR